MSLYAQQPAQTRWEFRVYNTVTGKTVRTLEIAHNAAALKASLNAIERESGRPASYEVQPLSFSRS